MNSTTGSKSRSRSPRATGGTLRGTGGMNATLAASGKQKQMSPSSDLLRSFKATTNLAHGLTKERIKI